MRAGPSGTDEKKERGPEGGGREGRGNQKRRDQAFAHRSARDAKSRANVVSYLPARYVSFHERMSPLFRPANYLSLVFFVVNRK